MLSADEDITTELNRVVCRLMRLALRTSKGRQDPPPTRWMQCKLLDLLTLTEKSILRRKGTYIDRIQKKLIGYNTESAKFKALAKLRKNQRGMSKLINEYNYLLDIQGEDIKCQSYHYTQNAKTIITSNEDDPASFVRYTQYKQSSFATFETTNDNNKDKIKPKSASSQQTRTSKRSLYAHFVQDEATSFKKSKTNIAKSIHKNKSHSNTLIKNHDKRYINDYYKAYKMKTKRIPKDEKRLHPTASKPIPSSLIELCHPERGMAPLANSKEYNYSNEFANHLNNVADENLMGSNKESELVDIVMENAEDSAVTQRTIGTKVEENDAHREESILGNISSKLEKDDCTQQANLESVESKTIFLFDINEPSTSKGIRHCSMDVQCGTDTKPFSGMVTPINSVTRMAKVYSNGIKIDSLTNVTSKMDSIGVGPPDVMNTKSNKETSNNFFSMGIKIGDSVDKIDAEKDTLANTTTTPKKSEDSESQPVWSKNDNPLTPVSTTFSDICTSTQETDQTMETTSKAGGSTSSQLKSGPYTKSTPPRYTSIRFKESVSDIKSKNTDKDDKTTYDSKSPESFPNLRMDDSLSNLLVNFDYCSFQSQSVTPRSSSPTSHILEKGREDQKLSFRNSQTKLDILGKNLLEDVGKSAPQQTTLYTKLKMVDLVNDVSIEQEIESSSLKPSNSCKILMSKNCERLSPEIKCEIKKSSVQKCITSNQTAEISTSTEKLFYYDRRNCVEKGVPLDIDYELSKFLEHTEPQFSYDYNSYIEHSRDMYSNSPKCRHFGFKIKDKNENVIKKVEFSSTRVELLSEVEPVLSPIQELMSTIPSAEDTVTSILDFSDLHTSPSFTLTKVVPSDSRIKNSNNDISLKENSNSDINETRKIIVAHNTPRTLTCGGLHIHSYKEKQYLEDVVYKGKRKALQCNTIEKKKEPEIKKPRISHVSNKENPPYRKFQSNIEIKVETKKPMQVRCAKNAKVKQDAIDKAEQLRKVALPNLNRAIRANNIAMIKVATKTMTKPITSRNIRSLRSTKKAPSVSSVTIKNNFNKNESDFKRVELDSKYLPPYLIRRKKDQNNLELELRAQNKMLLKNEMNKKKVIPSDVCMNKTKEELLKIHIKPRLVNYAVFRNELENSSATASNSQSVDTNRTDVNKRRRSHHKRSSSPISQNSSTCSTAESTATVRANSNWTKSSNRKQLILSNKSSTGNTDSDASPSAKSRKYVKRSKNKKSDGKESKNKENNPDTETNAIGQNKECLQNGKSVFMGRTKNVIENLLARNSKHQTATKSNFKLPPIENNIDKKKSKMGNVLKKKSGQSQNFSDEEIKPQSSSHAEPSNIVLLVDRVNTRDQESAKNVENVSQHAKVDEQSDLEKVVDTNLLVEWFERGSGNSRERENTENAILESMRNLVEERLNFIGSSLKLDENPDADNTSFKSFRTVITLENSDTFRNEIENVVNHSLDAVSGDVDNSGKGNENNTDQISFKSYTSPSLYSEYFFNNQEDLSKMTEGSVLDLFERKDLDTALMQNCPGNLASQAFSGFSMNADSPVGDQIDFVPNVDSGSDSLAVDVTRQTTSEELFISGRSSETYESCIVEEEVSVPDWLFRVMNPHLVVPTRQQRTDPVNLIDSETGSVAQGFERPIAEGDEEHQELLPLQMPLVEPGFDVNGNVLEPGIGLGAGAGDGRGMHSDHSQDSSGQGSSLSSSEASSGQQSESILIDPSAFAAQFELFHEPVGSSMAVTTLVGPVDSPVHRQVRSESEALCSSRDMGRDSRPRHLPPSDGEADISSIDTDAQDSS